MPRTRWVCAQLVAVFLMEFSWWFTPSFDPPPIFRTGFIAFNCVVFAEVALWLIRYYAWRSAQPGDRGIEASAVSWPKEPTPRSVVRKAPVRPTTPPSLPVAAAVAASPARAVEPLAPRDEGFLAEWRNEPRRQYLQRSGSAAAVRSGGDRR